MIHRPYDELAIYGSFQEFADWKKRATEGLKKVRESVQKGEKPQFDSSIYGRLKEFQLACFRDKCAYCEVSISVGFWGDVEHYRPKKKVEEEAAHGGYYWLAYEPSNLMPSCQRCNQGAGKKNHFPVRPGTRAFDEAGLAGEQPLLLSPYLHKPSDHLAYDFDVAAGKPTGYVKPLSDEGRTSIEIYKLNRQLLVDDRLEAQQDSINAYKLAKQERELDTFFRKIADGRLSYLAARVAAIRSYIDWYRSSLENDAGRLII